jgi:hypothetical protein
VTLRIEAVREALRAPRNLALLGGGVVLAALGLLLLGGRSSGYQVLLQDATDPGEVLRLADLFCQQGIRHRIEDGGRTLQIAEGQMEQARTLIIEGGMSQLAGRMEESGEGFLGFGPDLGLSPDASRARRLRRTEAELARTLSLYPWVRLARVHLNLPAPDAFGKEASPPSASVFLRIREGNRPSSSQARALRMLVAHAVKGLEATRVILADSAGTDYEEILEDAREAETLGRARASFTVLREFEERSEAKLREQLGKVFGLENIGLCVSADLCEPGAEGEAARVCVTSVAVSINANVVPDGLGPDGEDLVRSAVSDALGLGAEIDDVLRLRTIAFAAPRRQVRVGDLVADLPAPEAPVLPPVSGRAGGEMGLPLGIFFLMTGALGVARYARCVDPECEGEPVASPVTYEELRQVPDVRRVQVACWADEDPVFAARILTRLMREGPCDAE